MKHKNSAPQTNNHRNYHIDNYDELLDYVNKLASHKMGYPVSLLTYLGVVRNDILGIQPDSLANVLLNNVGDPFKDSETSLLEVKAHERKIISILEKYYGLQEGEGRGYVTTGGTEGNFAALWWSKRYLISLSIDLLIEKDSEIKLDIKKEQELTSKLTKIPLDDLRGRIKIMEMLIEIKNKIVNNKNKIQELLTPTVFYTKNHTHYSIPKVSEILKLNIRPVSANEDGSMNLNDFKKEVLLNLGAHPLSSIIVIANIGTTITGAIDDVPAIKSILDSLTSKPKYSIHLDGALTGFVLPIIKPYGNVKNYFDAIGANTLAVSAHKYPGLSQPCGIMLTTKKFFDKAFDKAERSIEYVGNISDVTITGSRSGLNVLMFYNALHRFELEKTNKLLTKMVNENIENAKYLQSRLNEIFQQDQVKYLYHFNVSFPKPSPSITKKYQLMLSGEKATICVLTNVTKKLIDEFIDDLKKDKESAMSKVTSELSYTIHQLDQKYATSTKELFIKSFCESEPITKHLRITRKEYEPFANEVIEKAIKDGLSKVAVDDNNQVIACAIAEDLASPFQPKFSHYPKLKPIFNLIETLSSPFLKGRKYKKNKVVHLWIAAVHENYRGIGLSVEITMNCIQHAAHKGFDFVYAEFTNEISENITHQFKTLQLCNKINYDSFVDQSGNRPFEGVHSYASAYVATIKPGIKFDSLVRCYDKTTEKIHAS